MNTPYHESDDILKRLFDPKPITVHESLEELFFNRLETLAIPKTTALSLMGMTTRTLDGILTGEQKMLDYTQLVKLANFLGISLEQVAKLYLEKVQEVYPLGVEAGISAEVVNFVNEKFNLAELRKIGLISSLTNYDDIVDSICKYFGLRSIFDYKEPEINVAFSAGKRAKQNCSVSNWMFLAEQTCIELRNPNVYSRENLIDYFPHIRWQTMDIENGFTSVIRHLYQLGITVVLIPSFPSLHVRGATFSINDKPCIALTDYVGLYSTFWFGLIHELYHVLFDWDEIRLSSYHISRDNIDGFNINSPVEIEADSFARKYLFSKEKTSECASFINNDELVKYFAINNNVEPSFVYTFYAYDAPKSDKYAWGRAKKKNPERAVTKIKAKLQNNIGDKISFSEHIKKMRNTIYN